MKVLVLNCGSSSIKYKLFDMTSGEVMAQGGIEKIGLPGAFLKLTDKDGKKVVLEKEMPGHKEGIEFILSILTDKTYGCIKEYNEIDAVGHRVVHGGEMVASSVKIDRDVINKVIECSDLAPLHNPANLKGIDAMEALIPISDPTILIAPFLPYLKIYTYTLLLYTINPIFQTFFLKKVIFNKILKFILGFFQIWFQKPACI